MGIETTVPAHVAIIMDGNGRWAKERGLPRIAGHQEGVKRAREVIKEAAKLGLQALTLYAFSTENWKRPKEEVGFLMRLIQESLEREITQLARNNIVFRASGMIDNLPEGVRHRLIETMRETSGNSGMVLNIAVNYGGRAEIIQAMQGLARDVLSGRLTPEEIDESALSGRLWTAGIPDPDLVIRASGEQRLSNFLLWQAAYAELYLTPVLWPDFGVEEFHKALLEYQKRARRFGGL